MKMDVIERKICPKCGQTYVGHPALSREDNATLICPDCGVREAMASIGVGDDETEKILAIIRSHTLG